MEKQEAYYCRFIPVQESNNDPFTLHLTMQWSMLENISMALH